MKASGAGRTIEVRDADTQATRKVKLETRKSIAIETPQHRAF
jgi:hypothetical protein